MTKKLSKENIEVTFLLKYLRVTIFQWAWYTQMPHNPLDLVKSRSPHQDDQQPVVSKPGATWIPAYPDQDVKKSVYYPLENLKFNFVWYHCKGQSLLAQCINLAFAYPQQPEHTSVFAYITLQHKYTLWVTFKSYSRAISFLPVSF